MGFGADDLCLADRDEEVLVLRLRGVFLMSETIIVSVWLCFMIFVGQQMRSPSCVFARKLTGVYHEGGVVNFRIVSQGMFSHNRCANRCTGTSQQVTSPHGNAPMSHINVQRFRGGLVFK